MNDQDWLAERFEQNRGHLRAVAYRMLGSLSEADDAIQETWLRLGRSDTSTIDHLGGWLTTVVARICLDMLRSRTSRREESLDTEIVEPPAKTATPDPEQEAVLADSVGLALLVVLDRLSPAERLAFVLHDLFAVPFDEIARIVGRTEEATRQLASRARRRVQGGGRVPDAELHQQRDVVDKFLVALRAGDFEGLVAVLDPDVLVHIDEAAAAPGAAREIRGAASWAKNAIAFSRGARFVRPVLVDGTVGAVLAPQGHLSRVLRLTIKEGRIREVEIIGDSARLQELDLAVLEN
ncbi:MAG TPA: sigma-70 family RNA polymerase sigma factor [Terriglobales bacterium]|jgi:RNA polymerase sigma factor (sigma-70 family)|nr:sigma-70 family RNA polymerase sigma factor [Terriglobales bacterium]